MTYRCSCCGEEHDDLPDIAADAPDYYYEIPEDEREARAELTSDTCVIDGEAFFIRAVLEIPIHDYDQALGFGVWVSQKRENFDTYVENPDTAEIGPFFGWLSTALPNFGPDTVDIKTMAHFRGEDLRPLIEVELTDHRLSAAQREGISLDQAWEIVHFYFDE
ncbi:MAG: DUF2199 domain-containing protein [Anaerolineae bacterium]|nr:DUF2199 domain-containing protein [Anaerolineae bacterium]